MSSVLMPLPALDFDPTEAAVSWNVLTAKGHSVVFATPEGAEAVGDELMISGEGLDPWGLLPGVKKIKVLGAILRANAEARAAYDAMVRSPEFLHPRRHDAVRAEDFDGFVVPGGHRARGMRPYLESKTLQALIVRAFELDKPVAAVCHGVLLVARSVSPATGRSVLFGKKTTSLTWAQERLAANLARFARFWDPHYYRTYLEAPGQPAGFMGVQAEVTRALARPEDYLDVPRGAADFRVKTDGRHRDTMDDERPAFVVQDGTYLSARWPGDVHTFAKRFASMLP